MLTHISSADDPRLDDYRDILARDRRGPAGRPGVFIGETALTVEKMLAKPGLTRSVLIAPNWVDRFASLTPEDVPLYVVPFDVMRVVTGFPIHRGVLAAGVRPREDDLVLERVVPRRDGPLTVLVCDGISNLDNIGLLFRNAAAFAVDAVVLSPTCHDPLYRKSIRVSIGHVLDMPWARAIDWRGDLERLKRDWGVTLIGAAGQGAVALDDVERPDRVALVVGQEFTGLSRATRELCDTLVRIPMATGVDSLNVAAAAAVCLHRLSRGLRA